MLKEKNLTATKVSFGQVGEIDLRREGAIQGLHCFFTADITLAGGATSGTVRNNPVLNPGNFLKKVALEFAPKGLGHGEIAVPVALWHLVSFHVLDREPRRAGLANGDAATTTVEFEFYIPCAPLKSVWTEHGLLNTRGKDVSKLKVTWPDSAADARDQLLTGNDRTLSVDANARLEVVQVYHVGDIPADLLKMAWKYTRRAIQTGENPYDLNIDVGNRLRKAFGIVYDNSARSDALPSEIKLSMGGEDVREYKYARLLQKNQADHQIAKSTWMAGGFILDLDQPGDMSKLVKRERQGEDVRLMLDTGTTAPAGGAGTNYVDLLIEEIEVSERAKAVARERDIAI